jgi:hypothetical protein
MHTHLKERKPPGIALRAITEKAKTLLLKLPSELTVIRPGPHSWSPIEILGHLLDCAVNNHRRIILARQKNDLVFHGYDQDFWVSTQNYLDENWGKLVILWSYFNLHLAHVIDQIPDTDLQKLHTQHSLDKIAFQPLPEEQAATLDYLVWDYIHHLKHHLPQIFPRENFGSK